MRGTTTTIAQSREARVPEFVDWSAAHIIGDEKGQAPTFLDHPFRASGEHRAPSALATPLKWTSFGTSAKAIPEHL